MINITSGKFNILNIIYAGLVFRAYFKVKLVY